MEYTVNLTAVTFKPLSERVVSDVINIVFSVYSMGSDGIETIKVNIRDFKFFCFMCSVIKYCLRALTKKNVYEQRAKGMKDHSPSFTIFVFALKTSICCLKFHIPTFFWEKTIIIS